MIHAFATRAEAMAAAAQRIGEALERGIAARGSACAALSGGSTPEPAYRLLSDQAIGWKNVTLALVDERFVPPSDPASNEGLLWRTLGPALAYGAKLAPMYSYGAVADAADRADVVYRALSLDVALMGMGEDGHTASWFPNARGLAEALDPQSTRSVIAIHADDAGGAAERLTLTRAAIARAASCILLITGDAKRATLERALGGENLPVARLFDDPVRPPEVIWAP